VAPPVVNGPQVIGGNGVTRFILARQGVPDYPQGTGGRHTFGVVYANDIAFADMNATPRVSFRPGAIIVREKLSKPDSTTPQLLAVMIKRETGFNPPANDWEFLVVTGDGTKIRKRVKKGACFGCHQSQKDLVYGDYEQK